MFGSKTNPLITDVKAIEKIFTRRLEPTGIFPNKEEVITALKQKPLRVYLGIDPTGPDIHIGHSIPVLFLKDLWHLGHKPVILIGDFTGRIGDPTGKISTRKQLSKKEIDENCKNYIRQIEKILPRGSFEVARNNDWLGKLSFGDVVELASHVTVQQMIRRDMFQDRLQKEEPIGLHEFLYPLMQGYDSVAMEIDGEVGGNDQTFNMLVGRTLEKKLINKDKLVFATRLLVDSDGKKMSKSEGALISLSDSPSDMFGKTMATISDDRIMAAFELCTEKDQAWIDEHTNQIKEKPYEYKKELALELVRMYHGADAAVLAAKEFDQVFSKGALPETIEEFAGSGKTVVDFMVEYGLAPSKSEAKRLVDQKAVKVNENTIMAWDHTLKTEDIIQVGPRKFAKVK